MLNECVIAVTQRFKTINFFAWFCSFLLLAINQGLNHWFKSNVLNLSTVFETRFVSYKSSFNMLWNANAWYFFQPCWSHHISWLSKLPKEWFCWSYILLFFATSILINITWLMNLNSSGTGCYRVKNVKCYAIAFSNFSKRFFKC